jgi:hypothetical protein
MGLRDLPPISYAAIRFVIAVIVLLAVSAGRVRLLPQHASDYVLLAFTGVLMFAVNYGLLFWGELYVSSGLAAVLQATIPIFGMVFAHLMLPAEPLRLQKVAGSLLALGGVTIICARLLGFNGPMAFWGGLGIVFGGALAAFSNVLLKARVLQVAPDDCGLADDFGAAPLLVTGFVVEGNPLRFPLERVIDLLFALSRGDRFCAHVSASLLASAANVVWCKQFVDHAAWRCHVGLGRRRGKVFSIVASGCLFGPCRCLDDFPQSRSDQASNATARRKCASTGRMI